MCHGFILFDGELNFSLFGKIKHRVFHLKFFSNKRLLYEKFSWLVFIQAIESVTELFLRADLNVNADIHVAVQNFKNESVTEIYDFYNPSTKRNGLFTVTKIGHFHSKDGYSVKLHNAKYWRRRNMTGVKFKTAVVIPDENLISKENFTDGSNRQIFSMHRFQRVLIEHCKDFYNFSLEVETTNSWGYVQADGKFDGLVRLLQDKVIDFGSSPLIFKFDRMPYVDYSFGSWRLRSTFIFKKPKQVENSYMFFLRPLEMKVWMCILLFMATILFVLKLSYRMDYTFFSKKKNDDSNWSATFLFIIGAFCQQGAPYSPISFRSRIIFVMVFVFFILIYQYYSASIVTRILLDPPSPINNLQDLLDSTMETGVEDILIDKSYFQQTTDPVAKRLFNEKIKLSKGNNGTGFYDPPLGLHLVRKGGFAFHVETSTAYPIIENTFTNPEICEIEEVQMYRTQPMHANLPKHSPFREMLNYCMLRLVEHGLMFRQRKYWDARKPGCIETEKKREINVSLKEFSCALVIMAVGVLITFLVLLFENVVFYWEHILENLRKFKDFLTNLPVENQKHKPNTTVERPKQ